MSIIDAEKRLEIALLKLKEKYDSEEERLAIERDVEEAMRELIKASHEFFITDINA